MTGIEKLQQNMDDSISKSYKKHRHLGGVFACHRKLSDVMEYDFYVKTEIQGCISIRNVLQQYYKKMNFKLASFSGSFF